MKTARININNLKKYTKKLMGIMWVICEPRMFDFISKLVTWIEIIFDGLVLTTLFIFYV